MIIHTTDIQLYEILKQKLGSKEAEVLVNFVDTRIKESNEINLKNLATKQDIADLSIKIAETKTDMIKWIFALFVPMILAIVGLYFRK